MNKLNILFSCLVFSFAGCIMASCQSNKTLKYNSIGNNVVLNTIANNSVSNMNVLSDTSQIKKFPNEKEEYELVTYEGRLKSDGKQSTILYLGEESGDLAGFCFVNDSDVGRLILSKCKVEALCEFTGRVDWKETECPFGDGMFSGEARIVSIKAVKRVSE